MLSTYVMAESKMNDLKRRTSGFLHILAEKIVNDLGTTKPSDVRRVLMEAAGSLPDGVLKTQILNNNDLYYKKLKKIMCKDGVPLSTAEKSSSKPKHDHTVHRSRHLLPHSDGKLNPSTDASSLTSKHHEDITQYIDLPCNAYHSNQRINRSVLVLLQGELALKTLSALVSTRLHRLHSNSSLLEDWKERINEVNSDSQKLASRWLVQLCTLSSVQRDPMTLTNLMFIVFSIIQQESEMQLEAQKINKCHELKDDMRRLITFFYMKYVDTELLFSPVQAEKYKDLMASLLSVYLDLAIFCSRSDGNACVVGRQCCVLVSYTLEKWPAHCLDVLLQLTILTSSDADVVMPLIRKSISKLLQKSGHKLSHKDYTRVVICTRQMMALFGALVEDVNQMVCNIPAPKSYISWLKEQSEDIAEELPDDSKFRKRVITRFLLQDAEASLLDRILDLLVCDTGMHVSGDVGDQDTVISALYDGHATEINHEQTGVEDEASECVRGDDLAVLQQDDVDMFFVDKGRGMNDDKGKWTTDRYIEMEQAMEIIDLDALPDEHSVNTVPETQINMYGLDNCDDDDDGEGVNEDELDDNPDATSDRLSNDSDEESDADPDLIEECRIVADILEHGRDRTPRKQTDVTDASATEDETHKEDVYKNLTNVTDASATEAETHREDVDKNLRNVTDASGTEAEIQRVDVDKDESNGKSIEDVYNDRIYSDDKLPTDVNRNLRIVTDASGTEADLHRIDVDKDVSNDKSIEDVDNDRIHSDDQLPVNGVNTISPESKSHSKDNTASKPVSSISASLLLATDSHKLSDEIVYDSVESHTCLFGDGPPSEAINLAKHLKTREQERDDFNKLRQIAMNAVRGISLNDSHRKSSVTGISTLETSTDSTQVEYVSHPDNQLAKSDISVYDFRSESSPESKTKKLPTSKSKRPFAAPLQFVRSKRVTRGRSKSVSASVNAGRDCIMCIPESDIEPDRLNQTAPLVARKRVTRTRSKSVPKSDNLHTIASDNLMNAAVIEPPAAIADKCADIPVSVLSEDQINDSKTKNTPSALVANSSSVDNIFGKSPKFAKNYSSFSRRLSLSDSKKRQTSRNDNFAETISGQRLHSSDDIVDQAGPSRVTRRSLALTQLHSSNDHQSQLPSDDQSPVKRIKTDSPKPKPKNATPKKQPYPKVSDKIDNRPESEVSLSAGTRSKDTHNGSPKKSSTQVQEPLSQRTPRKRRGQEEESLVEEPQDKGLHSVANSPKKMLTSSDSSRQYLLSSPDNLSPQKVKVPQQNSSTESQSLSPLSSHTRSHTLMKSQSPAKRRSSRTFATTKSPSSNNSSDNLHQSKMTSFFNSK